MENIKFSSLPDLYWQRDGAAFAGITTQPDGTHVAVLLLQKQASNVNWADAKAWATSVGGTLPTSPISALLFANVNGLLPPECHWMSDEYSAFSAWCCDASGEQFGSDKSSRRSAVAVRLIPIVP